MDNTNTVKITLQITDDGTIKIIDQAKAKTDDLGETTARASAKGVSGLKQMKASWLELAAGVTAGYFTIKKGIDVITGLVNIAGEAEQIEKRAAFQMETWGYKFQEIKPYVDAFAESIMRTTRFSDEMARQGLGQMMQYTSNIEEAMKGVQMAMNISTQSGRDLNSMIQYVGLAMHGNVEILGKWIPELKDLESKLGANATEAEKWAYTQGLLNKMFGGAAQADLATYRGQLAQLKNQWDEIKETIGTALMPSAQDWVAGMQSLSTDFAESIKPTIEKLKKEQRNLEDWLSYGMQGGASAKYVEDYERRIDEVKNKIKQLESATTAAAEAQKKAAEQAAKIPAIGVTPPEKDWIKKWVADFDGVTYALDKLGIKSTAVLSKEASDALRYAEVVKKAFEEKEVSVRDYINALNMANDAMKKLTGEDLAAQREEAWDKNAETIKGISKDEEGWLKKVNKANDDLFKSLKDLDKLKVPTHADVGPMEREVNAMKEKLRAEGLVIPVTTEGGTESIKYNLGGGWQTYNPSWGTPPVEKKEPRTQSEQIYWKWQGENEWKDFKDDLKEGIDVPIMLFGIGSSKKPITEKIREIIGEFGGLEKALSGMEAEINVAELSMERSQLQRQVEQINQYWQAWRTASSLAGSFSFGPGQNDPMVLRSNELMEDLVQQLKINQMKMGYERLKAYGGSYQGGTQYVPQTGLYTLHEGERVTTKNQISMGGVTAIFQIKSTDPKETANEVVHVLKYKLHGELSDLLRR